MSFTKGPWSYIQPGEGEWGPGRVILAGSKDPYRDEICVLYTNPDGSPGNGALIAAAPDLLDALKTVAKRLEDGTLVRDISRDGKPNWALEIVELVSDLNKIQLAIAKAEGK